jgi:hypothetical protein
MMPTRIEMDSSLTLNISSSSKNISAEPNLNLKAKLRNPSKNRNPLTKDLRDSPDSEDGFGNNY